AWGQRGRGVGPGVDGSWHLSIPHRARRRLGVLGRPWLPVLDDVWLVGAGQRLCVVVAPATGAAGPRTGFDQSLRAAAGAGTLRTAVRAGVCSRRRGASTIGGGGPRRRRGQGS